MIRNLQLLFLITVLSFSGVNAFAAIASGQLPEKKVKVMIKDKPFKDTMTELFKMTKLKVRFAKDLDIERSVYIDVESVKWSLIFTSAIEAYQLKYRFVRADTVEIYRP